jgi:hypothetical protein
MTPYLIGTVLALGVGLLGTFSGLERDRAYYAVITIVVPSYFGLYAVLGGSTPVLLQECVLIAVYLVGAVVGFQRNLWLLAALLAGHGLFDAVHGFIITNPGMPAWWPAFCGSFDIVAGAYLAVRLGQSAISARPLPEKLP